MLIKCDYSGIEDPSLYEGKNLAEVFKSEIRGYPGGWQWIKDRIKNADLKGIRHRDYMPLTIGAGGNEETHEMQIAGINPYKGATDQDLDDHIDFISRDCYSQAVQWNLTNNNNGTAETPYPYLASNVHKFLEELYEKLPADVKKVIVPKRTLLERRYSASGALTDSTGWSWESVGKLWLPSEYEVLGSVVWGTKGWSSGQAVQYPVFANSWKNRIKGAGPGGDRCTWWLLTVEGGNALQACRILYGGYTQPFPVSNQYHVPLCFRITAES